jgi:hypothetical protein
VVTTLAGNYLDLVARHAKSRDEPADIALRAVATVE